MNKLTLLIVFILVYSGHLSGQQRPVEIILKPAGKILMTDSIQSAIDRCAAAGEGIVRFMEGVYLTGGIQLKSKVRLYLEKGVVLQGSDKYADYKNDAFMYGKDLSDISIEGEGIIDGVDCYNPNGEEGFRGPHCIKLINCRNIKLEGITIKNSANWAINCRYCSKGIVTNVKIRGGHDGLHTRFCNSFTVTRCDFRTGDDSFAGNDNRDFTISDCLINTSCNGFRMGCYNFTVRHCKLWGPGEYSHKIQKRNNMLSAFDISLLKTKTRN
jgi:polygalacturonase